MTSKQDKNGLEERRLLSTFCTGEESRWLNVLKVNNKMILYSLKNISGSLGGVKPWKLRSFGRVLEAQAGEEFWKLSWASPPFL